MKKLIPWFIAAALGLAIVISLNILTLDASLSGIKLPFGWQGPEYQMLRNYNNWGLPFMAYHADQNSNSFYNYLAVWLNALTGITLGLATMHIYKNKGHRVKNKKNGFLI
jgi:hypothetical protein